MITKINNKIDFLKKCLRAVGDGVITINISEDQIDDCYSRAVLYFYDRHYKAGKRSFVLVELTEENFKDGYVLLPDNVDRVVGILRNTGFGRGFMAHDNSFPIVNNSFGSMVNGAFSGFGILGETGSMFPTTANFAVLDSYLGTSAKLLSIEKRFRFHPLSRKLFPDFKCRVGDRFAVDSFLELDEDDYYYIHNDIWMLEYTTALIKKQWAENITKYKNNITSNGVEINGAEKLAEANKELGRLTNKLNTEYVFNAGQVLIG